MIPELIDKYIERIKIDYPEDDKLMIDLKQFGEQYCEEKINELLPSEEKAEIKARELRDKTSGSTYHGAMDMYNWIKKEFNQ